MNIQLLNKRTTILASAVLVTTLMMITAPSVYAASPDFTIEEFGIEGGNPTLTVKGTAGGTIPDEEGDIYAYVFFTDDGIYAVASHPDFDDSDEGSGPEWHAHGVEINDGCLNTNTINDDGVASLDGNTVAVEDTDAEEVTKVLTAVLSTEKKGGICVAKTFDSAEQSSEE